MKLGIEIEISGKKVPDCRASIQTHIEKAYEEKIAICPDMATEDLARQIQRYVELTEKIKKIVLEYQSELQTPNCFNKSSKEPLN